MNSDARKGIWKRLRFWGGVLLVVVVGIGGLLYWSYRKALGPPPTPPGKCREFDEHLAEIDKDWLFLFWEMERLVICDIYGNDKGVIVELPEGSGDFIESTSPMWSLSPGNGKLLVFCEVWGIGRMTVASSEKRLFLVDLKSLSSSEIMSPGGPAWQWFSDSTFLAGPGMPVEVDVPDDGMLPWRYSPIDEESLTGFGRDDGFGPLRGNETKKPRTVTMYKSYRYDADDMGNPQEMVLPELWFSERGKGIYSDTGTDVLLMADRNQRESRNKGILAYDGRGLRTATKKEAERFIGWMEQQDERWYFPKTASDLCLPGANGEPIPTDSPEVEVKQLGRDKFLLKMMEKVGFHPSTREAIELNSSVIRHAKDEVFWRGYPTLWESNIGLLIWAEYPSAGDPWADVRTLCSDRKGRYRSWHSGFYLDSIPRWKEESQEAGE